MPWRLIGFIILFGIFLIFIAFNLGNTCDISFAFHTFRNVPVFLTAFSSFVLGMFCAVPFIINFRVKRKKDKPGTEESASKAKKKWGKKGEEASTGPEGSGFSNGGPYGIN